MAEGGPVTVDKTEFTECIKTVFRTPYIMKLAFSAGIGGLLFGYDTGVISGALLYIKEDFTQVEKQTWLQETIVAMAVAGAIMGAGLGGWLNDLIGRRITIMLADTLFFIGALIMAFAPSPGIIILGRIFVGLGVGMASMTSPLYISETSPSRVRGALGATNGLLITGGQFLAYLINLGFTEVRGSWRWMLGVAAIPALLQFVMMFFLPESPRWLYRKGKTDEAQEILEKIYPDEDEALEEIRALRQSIDNEIEEMGELADVGMVEQVKMAFRNKVVRRGLAAGVTAQVAQQFIGINTVMYYSPTIVQLAGYASKKTALALSLVTSGMNAFGTVLSMFFVDRYGRRRLMLISMFGVIICLVVLAAVFYEAAITSPKISQTHFGGASSSNTTCPSYLTAVNPQAWSCMTCLKAVEGCAYCAPPGNQPAAGACILNTDDLQQACTSHHGTYFTEGCPSKIGFLAVVFLAAYIIVYSPGMGTVPWILNSEIYPLRFRGVGGGIAAVSNWSSNLVISESFLTLTEYLTVAGTFLLFGGFAVIGLVAIYFLVPETKGLPIEEIEHMLEVGFTPSFFCRTSDQPDNHHHTTGKTKAKQKVVT